MSDPAPVDHRIVPVAVPDDPVPDYVAALEAAGVERSMSRAGNCYDNAAMESFWSTLKLDTQIDKHIPATRAAAELVVFDYIETFYNRSRLHSSLDYMSPFAFLKKHFQSLSEPLN